MSRKKKPKFAGKKMDSVYLPSLKKLVDMLFQEAYDQKMNWETLAKVSGLSSQTVRKLGRYETKYPAFRTVELIARGLGGCVRFRVGEGPKKAITWTPKVFDGRTKAA